MPTIHPPAPLDPFLAPNAIRDISSPSGAAGNATANALHVVCAWPVSGQYGPGSRVLYYCLVAACVLARKAEWLRKACLAAALIFPAVAAMHALVLAALHVNDAVDMDIYGVFQLCAIGIFAAPWTMRLSRTYLYDPGRNLIFLWTVLLLAGLLSLTVEFYRIKPSPCTVDNDGNPIPPHANDFPYENANCSLQCDPDKGPHSPLRGGSGDNIYVIPAPDKLSFNTVVILAAGCCVQAILSLIFMLDKVYEVNFSRSSAAKQESRMDDMIEGTNGATPGTMQVINNSIRRFLSVIEGIVFGALVLAILVVGERNFFSKPVRYQTEPIASIGQWAPIAATILAVIGSLYLLLTVGEEEKVPQSRIHHDHTLERQPTLQLPSNADDSPGHSSVNVGLGIQSLTTREQVGDNSTWSGPTRMHIERAPTFTAVDELETGPSRFGPNGVHLDNVPAPATVDKGSRRRVAKLLNKAANHLGTAAQAQFDMSEFNRGRAREFPEIPGERHRNENLAQITRQFSQRRDAVLREQHSRSPAASVNSDSGVEANSNAPGSSGRSPPGSPSPSREPDAPRRRDTLEVPTTAYYRP